LITDYKSKALIRNSATTTTASITRSCLTTFMNKLGNTRPTETPFTRSRPHHHVECCLWQGHGQHADGRRQRRAVRAGRQPDARTRLARHHASAASVAKIPYRDAADGISLTSTLVPEGLGRVPKDRIANMRGILDAFFGSTGYT